MKKYNIIPGNDKLLINLEGRVKNIYSKDKLDELVKFDRENIILDMYGQERKVDKKWLTLICQYGFVMPCGFEEKIFEYRFREAYVGDSAFVAKTSKTRLPFEVVFENPVYYSAKFRIIPEFPEYAVSENKEFLDITTGKLLDILPVENKDFYPRVSLRHPFFPHKVNRLAHVLVCQTWHKNESFKQFPLVNHKDGNKTNWHSSNLEWVSHSENNKHAVDNKLREDNVPVKMRDSLNGNESIHSSIADAFLFVGARQRSAMHALLERNNGLYIYKERYEIRYLSDKTDFLSKTKDIGEIVNNLKIGSIDYEMKNIKTGTIHSGIAARLSKLTGIAGVLIGRSAFRKTIIKDWMIRKKKNDNPEWNVDDYTVPRNTPIFIEALDPLTNKVMHVFTSARKAGEGLGIKDKKTVQKRMLAGKLVGGFLLRRQAA